MNNFFITSSTRNDIYLFEAAIWFCVCKWVCSADLEHCAQHLSLGSSREVQRKKEKEREIGQQLSLTEMDYHFEVHFSFILSIARQPL